MAERLDLDSVQQRQIKGTRKSARKQLSLLRSGSDKVPADFAENLKKEIIGFLKPAQVELFNKALARGRPKQSKTSDAGKTPAKKP